MLPQVRLTGRILGVALILTVALAQTTTPQPGPSAISATATPSRIFQDVTALLSNGPRVAGSTSVEKARDYLSAQYRASGYQTRVESFEYSKFFDEGSELRVGNKIVQGSALDGSSEGEFSATLVAVAGVGTLEEFRAAGVSGKIAVVKRGTLRFVQKAQNALSAGARGLIIVNNAPGNLRGGTLGTEVSLPVLGVSGADGASLLEGSASQATLSVKAGRRTVTGRNLIASLPGVNAPKILFGAHLDSVQGAPGANDNASGTATVLELARRAAGTKLAKSAWFMAFDGEEDGLRGSRAFVQTHLELVRGLKAMLNFDMVGLSITPLSLGGTPSLLERAQKVLPDLRPLNDGSSGSDHASFLEAGAPALFFYRGMDPNYHQPGDTVVEPGALEETVLAGLKIADELLR